MADLFKNPLQALKGQDSSALTGGQSSVELAKENTPFADLTNDPNWETVGGDIDAIRWNKSYPYQLLMVENTGASYVIRKTFTLPIPPQELSITTPFAIDMAVTLGGIVEQHNGAPIRMINMQGTTGVLPLKGSGTGLSQGSIVKGIFAGTINAATNLTTAGRNLIGLPQEPNLVSDTDPNVLTGTGYYQFRLLQHFLESYVNQKKNASAQNLRLAFAMWKDQAVYLVTPMVFDVRRTAASPWEYNYSIQLKAWRRISLDAYNPEADQAFTPVVRDPNAFAQLLNKLQEARRVLQTSQDVLHGVRGDVEKILLEPLRETILFVKDTLGVAVTAADLPAQIVSSFKTAAVEAKAIEAIIKAGGQNIDANFQRSLQAMGIRSSKAEVGGASLSHTEAALNGAEEVTKIFDNPGDNFEIMETIKPSDLNLSPAIQKKIIEERRRVAQLTRLDFETTRDTLVEFQAQFADAVGVGSSTYDATYDRPSYPSTRIPTQDDFDMLFSLNQTILEMNRLAASSDINQNTFTTVEAVAGMASAAGIAFRIPVSKFAVPFPYGTTLEQLSSQYLGDPNRWHEIVALNGLRQPYVDEEGFDLQLLVNGLDNQIVVADASNLYIGQPVWVSATNTSRSKRRITKIEVVSPGNTILTLDGDPDLERYTVLASASIHAFLPDTVNSQQLIYIPSDDEPPEDDFRTKSIPGIDEFDPLIHVGGVDLLLTQSGDLAITPDGDCRLAVGLTNIIQRIRVAIGTPKGSLIHHPQYGLGVQPGVSTADLDAKQMKAALQDLLSSDPAFRGVSGVAISKVGPVCSVAMSIGVAGTATTIPLTVNIRR